MNRTKYLVTGAAGFIGSSLVDALIAGGASVIGLDNFDAFYDPAIKRRNVLSASADPAFRMIEGDIRDLGLVEDILRSEHIDCVIHLAARAGVRPSIEHPVLYQSVNVEGTTVVLEAMRRAGVGRMLFASSSSVYGNNPSVPFRESDNVDRPVSPYAATKKACELICHSYHVMTGMEIACLRFFTVYGPRQRPEMAIHKFTRLIAEGQSVPMFGDGTTARDYTYVDDVVQGIIAIDRNFSGFQILNIGESQVTTLRRLIELIGAALECTPDVAMFPQQTGDVDRTFADISSARALGYAPVTPIEMGIPKFVEWYQRQLVSVSE
jgi:UDP-glucuronate 4-epimerase